MKDKIKNIKKVYILYALAVISICIIPILSSALYSSSNRNHRLSDQNEQYAADIESLNGTLGEKDEKIAEKEESIQKLERTQNDLEQEIAQYQEQIKQIDELNVKFNELMTSYNDLLTEHEKAKNEIDSLNSQVSSLKAENEKLEKAVQQTKTDNTDNDGSSGTVYWVASGDVYHSTPDCPTLSRSKNIRSGSVSSSGKSRACKVCH